MESTFNHLDTLDKDEFVKNIHNHMDTLAMDKLTELKREIASSFIFDKEEEEDGSSEV